MEKLPFTHRTYFLHDSYFTMRIGIISSVKLKLEPTILCWLFIKLKLKTKYSKIQNFQRSITKESVLTYL